MSSSEQTERDNEVAQSQFLGPGSRERFLAEIETKGELVMRSDFYGDIRWRKTAPGKFVVEWLGKTSDIRTRITPAGHAWLAAKLCK